MSENFKPGDVAMVRSKAFPDDIPDQPRILTDRMAWWGANGCLDASNATARRLAVIDPENREDVERLLDVMRRRGWSGLDDEASNDMRAALREFANPTPPIVTFQPGQTVRTKQSKNLVSIAKNGYYDHALNRVWKGDHNPFTSESYELVDES